MEQIENSFKDILASLQTAKLYGVKHAITVKAIAKAYFSLKDILADRKELVIGIIGEELAFEKEIFFDLSKLLKQMIIYLKARGIERISFNQDLEPQELDKFIEFLVLPKEEIKGDPAQALLLRGVKNITISKVKVSGAQSSGVSSEQLEQAEGLLNIYEGSLNEIYNPLTSILNKEAMDGLSIRFALNNIIENLGGYYQQLLKLDTLKRYDVGTFAHLLNVSILSMYFASRLGFAKDVVMDIGLSALFHDIGKLYISRKTIRKTGSLSPEEFTQIESHTVSGAKLLIQYVDAIGIMPVVVSFEHHLKYDLSGYPRFALRNKQHIVSSVVSICDVYDALSQRRSYKTDYPPDMIYNLMMRGSGSSFDPQLIEKFFQVIGVWPVGSIILLSDKRTAVVVQENEDEIFLPVVKVIHPQTSPEVVNLKENKDIKIDHYLNPWTEGKEFLHLV